MRLLIILTALLIISSAQAQRGSLPSELQPFYHGVASGDPLSDRVIIWTRITPDNFTPGDSIEVHWRIATDTAMANVVNSGTVYTDDNADFTVKVDATNLNPYTCYYYDFYALNKFSLRGRTRTAPQGEVDSLRFAVVSCSNYEHGYFNSYRLIKNRDDVDAVLHLGDYIYEYETGGYSAGISGRVNQPSNEIITLSDYRTRYSHYRLDDDLRDLHQQQPFITIWDDHESANDSYKDGAENHDTGTEGNWTSRKSNAKQAYFEWMPVRENNNFPTRLYRSFNYGDLINLIMLDTRLEGRDEQVSATSSDVDDPNRSILGTDQYNWFKDQMINSNARWNIVGQQVMMAPLEVAGVPVNGDQWDGYNYERNRLYNDLVINGINNMVVLTGDIHTSWANDLPLPNYDDATGANSVGVEFVVTSVTSPGLDIGFGTSVIQAANDHMKWIDLTQHGYLVLDVNQNRVQGEWYFVDDIENPSTNETMANAFYTNHGDMHLTQSNAVSVRTSPACTQAPELPLTGHLNVLSPDTKPVILGLYPNPVESQFLIQLHKNGQGNTKFIVRDVNGKIVQSSDFSLSQGLNYIQFESNHLESGLYIMTVEDANGSHSIKFIKK